MEISNNFNRYDSTIQTNTNLGEINPLRKINRVKNFFEAFKVDLSTRALSSTELNDPNIRFPVHNPDILQYSQNLNLIAKP